jgi:hypothetical protein
MTSTSQSLGSSVLSRPVVIGASGLVRGTWHSHRRPDLEHFSLDQNPAGRWLHLILTWPAANPYPTVASSMKGLGRVSRSRRLFA